MNTPLRISLDEHVQLSERRVGGQSGLVVHHAGLQKYFYFGPEEAGVLRLIDGQRTSQQIANMARGDGIGWSADDISDFLESLAKSRLITITETESPAMDVGSPESNSLAETLPPNPKGAALQDEAVRSQKNLLAGFALRSMGMLVSTRVPLMHFDPVAKWLSDRMGWVFHPVSHLLWCVLVGSSLLMLVGSQRDISQELNRLFDQGIWIPLLAIWVICKICHEIGHAVSARRHNVRVGQTGVMFFLFAPLAYVDVTNAWKIPNRLARTQIALAGVYIELGLAALAAWVWYWFPDGLTGHLAAQVFFIAGPASLLVNANPLLRLDGYYVLSDLTDIPNLRSHGRKQLGGFLEWLLLGVPQPASLLHGWRRWFALMHAMASVVFQIVWMSGLIVAVSMWAHGLGILVAGAALFLWVVIPGTRWIIHRWRLCSGWRDRRRLVMASIMLFSFCHWGLSKSSPLQRRVPVIVRYHNEQLERAPSDAFVMAVYVTTGQRVEKGDLLMELFDEELAVRRNMLADELALAEHRTVESRQQGDLAEAQSAEEDADSMRLQLNELDAELRELVVLAKRAGVVTTPRPENLVGRHVSKGDELIRVSDPNEKELVVSVDEGSVSAYQEAVERGTPHPVRLRGGQDVMAKVASLRPRATRILPHPALSASAGGPLPVEPHPTDGSMQLIQPRLQSVCPLSPVVAGQIHSGQTGSMAISDDRSIGSRLVDWIWKQEK